MEDFNRTASFDVDAQKGFTPLCPNELPVPDGDKIVSALNAQATKAKYRIGSKDWHNLKAIWIARGNHNQFDPIEGANVDIYWNFHCIGGEKGAELLDGLPDPLKYDFFVYKGMEKDVHPYSAIYHDLGKQQSTGIIEFALCNGIRTFIIGGLATDYCVKETALDLKKAGFDVVLNLEACKGVALDTTKKAVEEMMGRGIRVTNIKQL